MFPSQKKSTSCLGTLATRELGGSSATSQKQSGHWQPRLSPCWTDAAQHMSIKTTCRSPSPVYLPCFFPGIP